MQQQQQLQQQQQQRSQYENQTAFNHSTLPAITSSTVISGAACGAEEFEDVDEDQISDLEEEEELRLSYERYRHSFYKQPDVASQLLQFADMVSADIKKYFGRSKDQDDACDVYEDKWATAKSGRELYYADLLRIAQGDTEPASKTTKKSTSSLSSPSSSSLSPHHESDNRSQFSGKRDDSVGMGPLTELFEYGLPSFFQGDKKHCAVTSRSKMSCPTMHRASKHTGRIIPMHERNFPESFWREPSFRGTGLTCSYSSRSEVTQNNMLTSSKLPDFSDLVESWQGGIDDMSSGALDKGSMKDISVDHQRL